MATGGATLRPAERLHMAYYIVTMFKRVPRGRRRGMKLIPEALEGTIRHVSDRIKELGGRIHADQALIARRTREVETLHARYLVEPPRSVLDRIREPWPSVNLVRVVYSMRWRILITAGPQRYATSDNPASFFRGFGASGT